MSKEVVVKHLPAGYAEGADDLRRWAFRRRAGRSGVPQKRDDKPDVAQDADDWLRRHSQAAAKAPRRSAPRAADDAAPWMRDRPPWRR
jgi:hypothetical protein